MIAAAVIRVIAATLPAGVRERYLEEWLADAAGASGLGMSPWSVVAGALGVAVGVDREDPLMSGMPPRRLLFRRLRVALAAVTSALLLLLFGLMWGIWSAPRSAGAPLAPIVERLLLAGVLLGAAVGLVALVGVLRARHRSRDRRRWGAADVAVAAALPLVVAATLLVPAVSAPLVLGGLVALLVVIVVEDPRPQQAPLRRLPAAGLGLFSALGILAALAGSLLHVYVWNPLARMPGMSLDEIYAGLAAARELPNAILPIAWTMLWCLAAVALVALAALPFPRVRRFATARRIAGLGILGVALVTGGSWFVGFGMGMGMADAFLTSGGDAAPSGQVLALVGLVYLIAAVFVGLLPTRMGAAEPVETT